MSLSKKGGVFWVVGSIVLISVIATGYHFYQYKDPAKRVAWIVNKVSSKLDLNAPQKLKLVALKDELINSRQFISADRQKTHAEIIAVLSKPVLDRDQLNNLVEQKTALFKQRSPQVIAAFGDFYDSLTVQQQAKLRSHVEYHLNERHRHFPSR